MVYVDSGYEEETVKESANVVSTASGERGIQVLIPMSVPPKYRRFYIVKYVVSYISSWNASCDHKIDLLWDPSAKQVDPRVAKWEAQKLKCLGETELSDEESPTTSALLDNIHLRLSRYEIDATVAASKDFKECEKRLAIPE